VKGLLTQAQGSGDALIFEDLPALNETLFHLEAILVHGLRQPFFGSVSLWDFVCNVERCLPGTKDVITTSRTTAKTGHGRSRLFIRLALNDKSLADYLSALVWDEKITRKYYQDFAIILHETEILEVIGYIKQLESLQFKLFTKDATELENIEYWKNVDMGSKEMLFSISSVPQSEIERREAIRQAWLKEQAGSDIDPRIAQQEYELRKKREEEEGELKKEMKKREEEQRKKK